MVVTSGGMDIEVRLLQELNADWPMVFNEESGSNVTVVKLIQLENTLIPMLVTSGGMDIEVRLVQP
jgi:hypothetical protein